MKSQFPHIQRKIAAPARFPLAQYILITFTMPLIMVNAAYSFIIPPSEEWVLRSKILREPRNSSFHESLGEFYITRNQKIAEREYTLSEEFYMQPLTTSLRVAGIRTSPMETFRNLKRKKNTIQSDLAVWEKLHAMLPDYTYAQLKLGVLYFQLGQLDKSRTLFSSVLQENPKNEVVTKLLEKLEGY